MNIIDIFNNVLTYPIFNALILIYQAVGDFGLAIIILTLLIKLILFPLTLKQLKSMKATQTLQPQMAEIKKKYAKDQRAQAQAMQDLYREYGMNPLAGSCLPLLIQMPVLFGLFWAFSDVLRNATLKSINAIIYPFLPHFSTLPNLNLNWFTFLNSAWHISLSAPDPTHILPVLAALATFVQLRMSQARSSAATTDAMATQMKIMQIISPAMVLFFGWNYAAGLALYWTVSSAFAIVQQYFVTGWGSLLIAPNLKSNKGFIGDSNTNGNSYTGDRGKETRLLGRANEPEARVVDDMAAPYGTQVQANGYGGNGNGTSSTRRRSRSKSSTRRRSSNNIPKRNPSRS
ncbi:MAG TPA: YidC/Oxa1 family membrane protein insertase [Ktedonobacteraceae bacterium]|nr:YidC/Oxa1 family membrane protein insertase [Ktedonobacteraceae bacterium]